MGYDPTDNANRHDSILGVRFRQLSSGVQRYPQPSYGDGGESADFEVLEEGTAFRRVTLWGADEADIPGSAAGKMSGRILLKTGGGAE